MSLNQNKREIFNTFFCLKVWLISGSFSKQPYIPVSINIRVYISVCFYKRRVLSFLLYFYRVHFFYERLQFHASIVHNKNLFQKDLTCLSHQQIDRKGEVRTWDQRNRDKNTPTEYAFPWAQARIDQLFNQNIKATGWIWFTSPQRGNFVDHIFHKAQCLAMILQHVSPLTMSALSCNSLLHTLPYKIVDN